MMMICGDDDNDDNDDDEDEDEDDDDDDDDNDDELLISYSQLTINNWIISLRFGMG